MGEIIEDMAKAGYERFFDDKWDSLHPNSIERELWRETARAMIKSIKFPRELSKLCRELALTPQPQKGGKHERD